MNFLKIYGVGIFILVFLTVNSEGSAQYLTGMVFYLAKSVLDGGLPGIIRTMRAGKSVPFVPPELPREERTGDDMPEMARARESKSVLSDSEWKVRRLVRQLWPDLDCETDTTCKVPADTVLKSDSRENSASTSSSEENFLAEPSAEEETMGNDLIGAETNKNAEEMAEMNEGAAEEEEDIQDESSPYYLTSAERERRRKIRRQNRMREREPPPPPPPPPYHFHNNPMYHDQEERDDDGMHPDGPPPPPPGGHYPPHGYMGPPPPWIRHFHRNPDLIRNKKKIRNNPIPVAVTQKHTPVLQDFIKYSKVFQPNPSTTTTTTKPTPPVISKRFLRILRQHHPSITF